MYLSNKRALRSGPTQFMTAMSSLVAKPSNVAQFYRAFKIVTTSVLQRAASLTSWFSSNSSPCMFFHSFFFFLSHCLCLETMRCAVSTH